MAIYFIQEKGNVCGPIKIGRACDPVKRLKELQTSSPAVLTILATIPDENDDFAYHRKFAVYHLRGEWFQPVGDLVSFIRSLPTFSAECALDILFKGFRRKRSKIIRLERKTIRSIIDRERIAGQILKYSNYTRSRQSMRLEWVRDSQGVFHWSRQEIQSGEKHRLEFEACETTAR